MGNHLFLMICWLAPCAAVCGQTQEGTAKPDDDVQAIHEELRTLRRELTDAVLAGDVERQLLFAHENLVTTWQNGDVTRGRQGLKDFLAKTGSKVFQGYTQMPEADDLSILYGDDTAIAFGSSVPHYKILGLEFDLKNRWTTTLVKHDGRWLVASYHVSGNILDNPVLSAAKAAVYWTCGIALVVGIGVGSVGTVLLRRMRAHAT